MATLFKESDTGALVWRDDIPGLSIAPVVHVRGAVTQAFAVRSITGIIHNGIDEDIDDSLDSRAQGREIWAFLAGMVTSTYKEGRAMPGLEWDGSPGGYGNQAFVDSPGGFHARYAHMREVVVEEGQWVEKGQLIGYGNQTGISTGDHHHGELWYMGDRFDWYKYVDWAFDPDMTDEEAFIMALSQERRDALNVLIDSQLRGDVVHLPAENKPYAERLTSPAIGKALLGLAAKAETLLDLPAGIRAQWVQYANNIVPLGLLGRVMRDVGFTEDVAASRKALRGWLKGLMGEAD